MFDASCVTCKYRRYHAIFARKYKTLQNVNILGDRFNSSGTPLFVSLSLKDALYKVWLELVSGSREVD